MIQKNPVSSYNSKFVNLALGPEIVIQNTDSKPFGLELKERNILNSSQNCDEKFDFLFMRA